MKKSINPATDDLVSKLLGSSAMQSLTMERNVGNTLRRSKWNVLQSCYYEDIREHKIREIDVVGTQLWERELGDTIYRVTLHAIIECKSAKAFHLLFLPGFDDDGSESGIHYEWLGNDKHEPELAEVLNSSGLTQDQVKAILHDLHDATFPDIDLSVLRLILSPPDLTIRASAFRETNTSTDKELDTSVLWRAGLALSSAISSFKEQNLLYALDTVRTEAKRQAGNGDEAAISEVLFCYTLATEMIDLYHPIVVIDSALWAVKDSKLERIKWCRLKQRTLNGQEDWWFDIVHFDNFREYMTLLTEHYKKQLLEAKAKRRRYWT